MSPPPFSGGHVDGTEIRIRPPAVTDADALGELHVATWRAAYHGLMPEATLQALSVEERVQRWRSILEISPDRTVVADASGRLVGFASFGPSRDPDGRREITGEIYGLYVAPDYWSRGVGWQLWTEARDRLCQAKFAEATLWVLEGNARARSFYERAGFARDLDAADTFQFDGLALPEVRYRITLS